MIIVNLLGYYTKAGFMWALICCIQISKYDWTQLLHRDNKKKCRLIYCVTNHFDSYVCVICLYSLCSNNDVLTLDDSYFEIWAVSEGHAIITEHIHDYFGIYDRIDCFFLSNSCALSEDHVLPYWFALILVQINMFLLCWDVLWPRGLTVAHSLSRRDLLSSKVKISK